jgi:hypothetical protein
MGFEQADRDIIIATRARVDALADRLDNLPCEQHPPECTQETRLESLETSRTRGIKAVVSTVIGLIVFTVGYLFTKIGG